MLDRHGKLLYHGIIKIQEAFPMDIRLLRYFLAAAREENITRAAESLHISQPSLSKQLMALEEELGKPLMIRGKRKITLTEEGVLLRRRAEEVVALMEKTEREISAASQVSGEVAIGGGPTRTILAAAASTRAAHPDVRFLFYGGDATDVLERLEHGSLDFAVCLEPVDAMRYEYITLPESAHWGVLMMADDPHAAKDCVQQADLADMPLIFHRRAGLQRLITRWAGQEIGALNIASTYNITSGSPVKFVRSGLGNYLTTEDQLPSPLAPDVCFRPLDPPLTLRYALAWNRYAVFSKAAEAFLKAMRN